MDTKRKIDDDVFFLRFMIGYCQRNRKVLIQLFDMNYQPSNPGDWFQLYDRSKDKKRLLLYMKTHLSSKPWLERFLKRIENKIHFWASQFI